MYYARDKIMCFYDEKNTTARNGCGVFCGTEFLYFIYFIFLFFPSLLYKKIKNENEIMKKIIEEAKKELENRGYV